jgi:hypothetical protein
LEGSILTAVQGIRINLPESINRGLSPEVVVLLNIKNNSVDFDVAREYIIDNDKLRNLLHSVALCYFQLLNKDFKSQSTKKRTFDFENEFSRYRFFRETAGWNDLFRFLTIDDKANLLLEGINPVLTHNGVTFKRLSTLVEEEPDNLVIFDCSNSLRREQYRQTISRMTSLIQGVLGENDTILLFFGPFHYQWESTLANILNENEIWFEWGNLENYVIKSCKIVKTKIDDLLPPGCHLAKIPKEFGKTIVRCKEFVSNKRQYNVIDAMFNWSAASRYGPILFFEDYPSIYEELVNQGIEENQPDSEIPNEFFTNLRNSTKKAEYLLDVDNKHVKMLIDNYDIIKENTSSLDSAKIMLRSLIIFTLEQSMTIDACAKGLFVEAAHQISRIIDAEKGKIRKNSS